MNEISQDEVKNLKDWGEKPEEVDYKILTLIN